MNIVKLSILLIFATLLSSGTIKNEDFKFYREVNTKQAIQDKYKFTIKIKESNKNFPEEITIKIENNCESIALYNFLLNFYSEEDSFWGINEDFRFTNDTPLTLIGDTIITKTFKLKSFKYKSMKTNDFKSFNEVKKTLLSNPESRMVATIGDPSKTKKLHESNLRTRSNMITIKTE